MSEIRVHKPSWFLDQYNMTNINTWPRIHKTSWFSGQNNMT